MADRSGMPRSLVSYLTLPRPGDLSKAIILPWGFVLAIAATGLPSSHDLLRALVTWFAIEYLVYQARYQWNDIRGFAADCAHPDSVQRGRLPRAKSGSTTSLRASAITAWLRLAVVALLVVLLPRLGLASVLLPSAGAVLLVAVVYESLRNRAAHHVPADALDGKVTALWLVAGGGYCVRGLTGVVLGSSGAASMPALLLAGAAFWAGGILFVTSRWAVESVPFASRVNGRLVWRCDPAQGRGHLLPLTRWIRSDAQDAPAELRNWRPLWVGSAWHAPWNLAAVSTAVLATAAAISLPNGNVDRGAAAALLALVTVGILYAVCLHQSLAEIGHWTGLSRLRARLRAPVPAATSTPRVHALLNDRVRETST